MSEPGGAFSFRPLGREDGPALLEVNRACPIVADLTICFERGPDFFAWPDRIWDGYEYMGICRDGDLVGYCMAGHRSGWTGTEWGSYFYIGDARVLPSVRGGRLAEMCGREAAAGLPASAAVGFGLVSRGNQPAIRAATRAHSELFDSAYLGPFEAANVLLLRSVSRPGTHAVRRAGAEDLDETASLMAQALAGRAFAPLIRDGQELAASLARAGLPTEQMYVATSGGRIRGALAVWDMHAVHRTQILRYSALGKLIKAGYGLMRLALRSAAPLPAAGLPIRSLTITRVAIEGRDPATLRDLLGAVIDDHLGQGYHLLHVGFAGTDPLMRATAGLPCQRFRSTLFAGARRAGTTPLPGPGSDPYIDLDQI